MSKVKLETQLRAILKEDERSTNSDIRLTQMHWYRNHRHAIRMIDGEPFINLKRLYDVTSQDSIKRVRAHIQNDLNEYLPTDPAVRKKRKISEQAWQEYLGYPEKIADAQTARAISWLNDEE